MSVGQGASGRALSPARIIVIGHLVSGLIDMMLIAASLDSCSTLQDLWIASYVFQAVEASNPGFPA